MSQNNICSSFLDALEILSFPIEVSLRYFSYNLYELWLENTRNGFSFAKYQHQVVHMVSSELRTRFLEVFGPSKWRTGRLSKSSGHQWQRFMWSSKLPDKKWKNDLIVLGIYRPPGSNINDTIGILTIIVDKTFMLTTRNNVNKN